MSARAGIGILLVALIFLRGAFAAWTIGEPAPLSVLAERRGVPVLQSQVVEGRQNGSLRHLPSVVVEWDGRPTELRGLQGSFYSYRRDAAEDALRAYTAGKLASVRVVNDRPMADRNDWFQIIVAAWLTIFGMLLAAAGTFVIALSVRRPAPRVR